MSQPLNGLTIGSVVFAQLTNEPNTQTTLRAPFVAMGRIPLAAAP